MIKLFKFNIECPHVVINQNHIFHMHMKRPHLIKDKEFSYICSSIIIFYTLLANVYNIDRI